MIGRIERELALISVYDHADRDVHREDEDLRTDEGFVKVVPIHETVSK